MKRQPDDPGDAREYDIPHTLGTTSGAPRLVFAGAAAVIAALMAFGILKARAESPRAEVVEGARFVIIDGDTVALRCQRPDCTGPERIRILNIDAPETRNSTCEAELVAGLKAKERLATLLRAGPVQITRCEPDTGRCFDRYSRTLARLSTATGDIGQTLIAEGHALPWAPGPEAKAQRQQKWCGR